MTTLFKTKLISTSTYHINAAVVISNNRIEKNGNPVLSTNTGDAAGFLAEAYRALGIDYPKFFKMDKLSKLGFLAADVLLRDASLTTQYTPETVSIVLSNANASLDADVKYMESVKAIPSPALFVYTLPNIVIGEISIRYGFKGENAFFIQPAFDAEWLYFYTQDLLQHNRSSACICGWVDIVDDNYEAVLFLVEKNATENAEPFNVQTIKKLYR